MAFVVIGGLITSTLLSLLVIPVVYSSVDDIVSGLRRLTPNRSETKRLGLNNLGFCQGRQLMRSEKTRCWQESSTILLIRYCEKSMKKQDAK